MQKIIIYDMRDGSETVSKRMSAEKAERVALAIGSRDPKLYVSLEEV